MRINRRAFLGTVVVAAGAAGATAGQRLAAPSSAVATRTAKSRAAEAMLRRCAAAAPVANAATLPMASALVLPISDVRVVAVHPVHFGALPVILEHGDARFQVDVFRRDSSGAAGVVETEELSLFIRNGGDGSADTGRTRELGARALGIALEQHGAAASLGAALLTFRQRSQQFPGGIYDVDYDRTGAA
jgi:hypothetical protein